MAPRDRSGLLGIGSQGAQLLGGGTAAALAGSASDSAVSTDAVVGGLVFGRSTSDVALAGDAGVAAERVTASAADSALAADVVHPSAQPEHVSDSALSVDVTTSNVTLARPSMRPARSGLLGAGLLGGAPLGETGFGTTPSDSALAADAATAGVHAARSAADSALASDAATARSTESRSTADGALTADAALARSTQARATADASLASDVAVAAERWARSAADSALAVDAGTTQATESRAVADSALSSDAFATNAIQSRTTADASLTTDVATTVSGLAAHASDSALAADAASEIERVARSTADSALAADVGTGHPVKPRAVFDAALSIDAATTPNRHRARAASDVALTTDQARTGHGAAIVRATADRALASDAAVGGGPRALDAAFTNDSAQSGIPRPFTFDAALARDLARVVSPRVHTRAADRALSFDQAAAVVHRAPPPVIPIGETPLFLVADVATGPTSRAPLTVESIRDRIECIERDLQRLQTNRFSVGHNPNQQAVPVHALSNAAAMGNASDQHHMAFNAETGEYEPSGPIHELGPALAGSLPAGPPYGFASRVTTGSFTAVVQGGQIHVPFLDDASNPIPFGSGVLGLVICVGDTERNL